MFNVLFINFFRIFALRCFISAFLSKVIFFLLDCLHTIVDLMFSKASRAVKKKIIRRRLCAITPTCLASYNLLLQVQYIRNSSASRGKRCQPEMVFDPLIIVGSCMVFLSALQLNTTFASASSCKLEFFTATTQQNPISLKWS